jgi:hypothetical protein
MIQNGSDGFTFAFVLVQKALLLESLVPRLSQQKPV